MFASPSIATGIGEGGWLGSGRSLVGVVKVVAGHHSLEAVVMTQEEGGSDLVLPVIVVRPAGRHHAPGAPVASLVVVIVHKDHSVHPISHAPVGVIDAPQAVPVPAADTLGQLDAIPELSDLANTKVLLGLDGLASHVNNFVEEQRSAALREILDLLLDGIKVPRPHVLAGVHSEALDPDVNQIVEVISNLLSDVILSPVEVVEADKVAVPDLVNVIVVVNLTVGLVKVSGSKRDSRIVQGASIKS